MLEKLLLRRDPFIAPFISIDRIGSVDAVLKHIGPAHIESPANNLQYRIDGGIYITGIIEDLKHIIDQIAGLAACGLIGIDGSPEGGVANPLHRRHLSGIIPDILIFPLAFGLVKRQIRTMV